MKTLARSILLIFIVLAALIAFMLTPTGLRASIALTSTFLPGKLTYQKISGVLIGPINIEKLHYQDKQQDIAIQQLRVNWRPSALLKKQLDIKSLQMDGLKIVNKDNTPFQWKIDTIKKIFHNIQEALSFFPIQINHAMIKNIDYDITASKQTFHFDEFYLHSLPAQTKWDTIFFATLKKPQALTLTFKLTGKPNHYALNTAIIGDRTNWILTGTGSENGITFTTPHTQLLGGSFNTTLNIASNDGIQWNANATANNIDLSPFSPNTTLPLNFILIGNGKQNGIHADPSFQIHLSSRLNQHKRKIDIALNGTFKQQMLTTHIRLHHSSVDLHLTGKRDQHNQWTGKLDQFDFWVKDATTLHLQKPVIISASNHFVTFTPLCLQSAEAGESCVQGKWDNNKIDLTANFDINHFKWISAWTRFVRVSHGECIANIRIDGPVSKPIITGKLHLDRTSLFFPQLNTKLDRVSVEMNGSGRTLNVTAQAFSAHQPLTAKGMIDLTGPDFLAKINITSNDALVLDTEEYVATATSDLTVDFKNTNLDITGKIAIPKANIRSNDYHAMTTLPASDIVYVGNVMPPPKSSWHISTNILLTLGNDVHIDNISGFSAKLGGNLRLLQTNNSEMLGTGRIIGQSGTYTLYGQALTLSPGSSVDFNNSPLDNPELNLKASKQIQSMSHMGSEYMQHDLTVGIELGGTIHSPKIHFFSNRSNLSQADILSYILLGYGSSSPIPGNTDLLLRALSAVKLTSQGLLGKQNIATQIQSGLGLSELGVESETTVDAQGNTLDRQSSFVVGKNFTRRLYARYSIGILDPVNVFELRYLINRQWAVQTDSSTLGNGADVLYTIAKN